MRRPLKPLAPLMPRENVLPPLLLFRSPMADSSAAIRMFLREESENAEELFSNERKRRDVSALNVDLTTRAEYSACKKAS